MRWRPRSLLAAAAAATILVAGSAPAARQPDPVKYTVINLVEPQPGQEDATKAYLLKHGDHVATYDGVLSFRLFEIVPGKGQAPAYKFMQVYELDRPRDQAKPPADATPQAPGPKSLNSVTYIFRPVGERVEHHRG